MYAVYSEIFARILVSWEIKPSGNGEITLSFTDVGKSCPNHEFVTLQICFNPIRENKILAKISEFTVYHVQREHNSTITNI